MNSLNQQKFMSIFNDMLTDRNGIKELEKVLKSNPHGDEVDQVTLQKEQALNMRLDQRNILFLKKVEEAKQKILAGTYGLCEDCTAEIPQKRLLARPTASLCIDCQEDKERSEFNKIQNRRDLTDKKLTDEGEALIINESVKFNSINEIEFESVVDQ